MAVWPRLVLADDTRGGCVAALCCTTPRNSCGADVARSIGAIPASGPTHVFETVDQVGANPTRYPAPMA
jgi:hypothetical protein